MMPMLTYGFSLGPCDLGCGVSVLSLQVVGIWEWGSETVIFWERGEGGIQPSQDEDVRHNHACLFQPQVQQLLHGVGRGFCEFRAARPDQPHGPCHWLSGGFGHGLDDLYSQWQRKQHLFPGEPSPSQLSTSICFS